MAPDAHRRTGMHCRRANTTEDVFPARDQFQVPRVDAPANSTQVVDGKVIGNRCTCRKLPRDAMCLLGHLAPMRSTNVQGSVTAARTPSKPHPTRIRAT